MGALNLMVAKSSAIWMYRKMLKAMSGSKTKHNQSKVWEKLKTAIIDFGNAANSIVKPLEYFSKLYDPKASNKGISSLADVLKVYLKHVETINKYVSSLESEGAVITAADATREVDAVKAGLVAGGLDPNRDGCIVRLGGEDIWIGGMQTQTLMTSHLTKLELLQSESNELVQSQLQSLYPDLGESLSLEMVCGQAQLSKPVDLLEWDKLEDSIRLYLKKHAEKYDEYIELSKTEKDVVLGAADAGLLEQLEEIDKAILLGMCYKEFSIINSIATESELETEWDRLQEDIKSLSLHPNKRTELLSELRYQYDELGASESRLNIPDKSLPVVGTSALDRLRSIVSIEKEFLPELKKIEDLYLEQANNMSNLKQLWLDLIDDDQKDTCIRWTGLVVTGLLRLNLIELVLQKRFPGNAIDVKSVTVTEDHPRLALYQDGISRAKLEALISQFI